MGQYVSVHTHIDLYRELRMGMSWETRSHPWGRGWRREVLVPVSVASSGLWLGKSRSSGMLVEKPGRAGKQREV